jgi:hypothetical protein
MNRMHNIYIYIYIYILDKKNQKKNQETCLHWSRLLRAACSNAEPGVRIEKKSRLLVSNGPCGTYYLAEVQIRGSYFSAYEIAVDLTSIGARVSATQKALSTVQVIHQERQTAMDLPHSHSFERYTADCFSRELAVHGGAWAEEFARGNTSRTRRLLSHNSG